MEQLKEFKIWIGRYTATGEDDPPFFVGKSTGYDHNPEPHDQEC